MFLGYKVVAIHCTRHCLKSHCRVRYVRYAAARHPTRHGSSPDSITTRHSHLVDIVTFLHMATRKHSLCFTPSMAIQARCSRTSVPASLHQPRGAVQTVCYSPSATASTWKPPGDSLLCARIDIHKVVYLVYYTVAKATPTD